MKYKNKDEVSLDDNDCEGASAFQPNTSPHSLTDFSRMIAFVSKSRHAFTRKHHSLPPSPIGSCRKGCPEDKSRFVTSLK